jgi:putative peptide zinc metalloprotease protein
MPLPVSRVHETSLVQLYESDVVRVYPPKNAILKTVHVENGQWVEKDQPLAEMILTFEKRLDNAKIVGQVVEARGKLNGLRQLRDQGVKPDKVGELNLAIINAEQELQTALSQEQMSQEEAARVSIVKAPRSGYITGLPRREEISKLWDAEKNVPFCQIGNLGQVRIRVPVSPPDYRLIKKNLETRESLSATILIPGRSDKLFSGIVRSIPTTDEKNVPLQLTHRGGGPIAIKPNADPNVLQPLAQTYLIDVDVDDPNHEITPGTLVQTKIHCEWKSAAWWVWRHIASSLDLGLL